MNAEYGAITRRQHPRISVPPTALRTPEFTLQDLSEGGARLHSRGQHTLGVTLQLTLAVGAPPL